MFISLMELFKYYDDSTDNDDGNNRITHTNNNNKRQQQYNPSAGWLTETKIVCSSIHNSVQCSMHCTFASTRIHNSYLYVHRSQIQYDTRFKTLLVYEVRRRYQKQKKKNTYIFYGISLALQQIYVYIFHYERKQWQCHRHNNPTIHKDATKQNAKLPICFRVYVDVCHLSHSVNSLAFL